MIPRRVEASTRYRHADFRHSVKRSKTTLRRRQDRSRPRKRSASSVTEKDSPMLGFLFGFNTRLGRLHYLLSTMALPLAMPVVIAAIVGVAIQSGAKAS